MTSEYRYRELDVDDEPPEESARVIIEQMGVDLPLGSLAALLRRTRHVYREALGDYLRRNDPAWRAPRRLPEGKGEFDYGADSGNGCTHIRQHVLARYTRRGQTQTEVFYSDGCV